VRFYVITDFAEQITGNWIAENAEMLIGATLTYESVGAGDTNCTVVNITYNDLGEITWECTDIDHDYHSFSYGSDFADTVTEATGDTSVVLTNLQEIAELGNNAPERIDVTVLSDSEKKSIAGLTDTAQDLAFKFLYEKEQFDTLSKLEGSKEWTVTLPDGTKATFTATASVKLAGVGVSAALTYTLTLSVESKIVFA
jgi:hypothetical protein